MVVSVDLGIRFSLFFGFEDQAWTSTLPATVGVDPQLMTLGIETTD